MSEIYIHLKESHALGGLDFELKIENNKAYFDGLSPKGENKFSRKINIEDKKLEQIQNCFDILRVKEWKRYYSPNDLNAFVMDGMDWKLQVKMKTYKNYISGDNAFPSFKDPSITSLDEELYCLLREGLFSILYDSVAYKDIL